MTEAINTRAIVTDIEGTTTSVAFVYDVLFPYASEHLHDYVMTHRDNPDVAAQLNAVRDEVAQPELDIEAVITQLLDWIRQDRKITPLKALQGMIWKEGFETGGFTGHVYEDAYRNLQAWQAQGMRLFVYSSGSVEAQKLLFGHSDYGDMTTLFSDYFDTRIGGKREASSYRRIVDCIGLAAEQVLFLSDIQEELDAADSASLQTAWLIRDGAIPPHPAHPVHRSFDSIAFS